MTATQTALNQLNDLLIQYDTYRNARNPGKPSGINSRALCFRFHAALERLTVPASAYAKDMERILATYGNRYEFELPGLAGIATALRDDIAAGWMVSVVELAHADTYAGYLEMAEGLNGQGYKDAAAVIAGTSLEVQLKALAVKHGVSLQLPSGAPKKMDAVNAELKASGVYNALEHKQVMAWLAIRNSAAHGNYNDYDEAAVKGLVDGVGNFAVRHPA